MVETVVLLVTEIKVAKQWGVASMTLVPVGDILYRVEVPSGLEVMEGGKRVFDLNGIRHIIRDATIALSLDVDEDDY